MRRRGREGERIKSGDRVGKKKRGSGRRTDTHNPDKSLLTQDQHCGDIEFTVTHGVTKSACV